MHIYSNITIYLSINCSFFCFLKDDIRSQYNSLLSFHSYTLYVHLVFLWNCSQFLPCLHLRLLDTLSWSKEESHSALRWRPVTFFLPFFYSFCWYIPTLSLNYYFISWILLPFVLPIFLYFYFKTFFPPLFPYMHFLSCQLHSWVQLQHFPCCQWSDPMWKGSPGIWGHSTEHFHSIPGKIHTGSVCRLDEKRERVVKCWEWEEGKENEVKGM